MCSDFKEDVRLVINRGEQITDYYKNSRDGGARLRGSAEREGESVSGNTLGKWFYCSSEGWNSAGYLRILLDKVARRFKISAERC